jgi:nucleoside-diphosphate-sugar epimerase
MAAMRIFLTGGTGYVGSAALDAFLRAGHEVTALVRTPESARALEERGAHPLTGDLADPDGFVPAARDHDAYVLTASDHSARRVDIDRRAIQEILDVARQTTRAVVVYTSGVWVLGHSPRPATEETPVNPAAHVAWRPAHERLVLDAGADGLRTIVVRPGIVFGSSRGIVGDLFKDASNGLVRVIGDGENRWPLVYDRDLGSLYHLLVTTPGTSGIYHATDESDDRVNHIVEAILDHMPMRPEVRHVPLDEARTKQGRIADAMSMDQVVRSPRAKALGWSPSVRSVSSNVAVLLEEWQAGRRGI